jgi:hypothetical protein
MMKLWTVEVFDTRDGRLVNWTTTLAETEAGAKSLVYVTSWQIARATPGMRQP